MKRVEKGKIVYYTFEIFENLDFITHLFSTRLGGVSEGCYESMNLSFRNDKRENVIKNYDLLLSSVNLDYRNTVISKQTHLDNILYVDESFRGKGLLTERDYDDIDALVTDKKGVILTGFFADCVSLFFVDVNKKVVAISHAGWRGTVKQIGKKTVDYLVDKFNSQKKDILVGIGPSIGKCCFEVDEPVYKEIIKIPNSEKYIDKKSIKYNIDLQNINKQILLDCKIPEKNIEVSNICTKCNCDTFFSHRQMGDNRGSMAGFIQLN